MSLDEAYDDLEGQYLKSNDEVLRESFGELPLARTETGERSLFGAGPEPRKLPEKLPEYDMSRRTHDQEGKIGSDGLARQLHNDQRLQSMFRRLAGMTEEFNNKLEEKGPRVRTVENSYIEGFQAAETEEIAELRSSIAEDIEKEVYNELASIGAKKGAVSPEDFKGVLASKALKYDPDTSRVNERFDIDGLPLGATSGTKDKGMNQYFDGAGPDIF
jgi:hypothetical protein